MLRAARFALLGVVVVIALGVGGPATSVEAARRNLNAGLRGAYAFTTSRSCTVAGLPFVGPTFAIPSGTFLFRQAASDAGIITFNGNGTGTSTGRSSVMNISAGSGGILSISEFTSTFDYTVHPDGTFDTATSTVFETVLGSGVGNIGTVSGQVGRSQLAHGKKMFVSAPREQITNETLVITPPVGASFTQHRICTRSTTASKLSSRSEDSDD